jgi:hypothetical protein
MNEENRREHAASSAKESNLEQVLAWRKLAKRINNAELVIISGDRNTIPCGYNTEVFIRGKPIYTIEYFKFQVEANGIAKWSMGRKNKKDNPIIRWLKYYWWKLSVCIKKKWRD